MIAEWSHPKVYHLDLQVLMIRVFLRSFSVKDSDAGPNRVNLPLNAVEQEAA